MRTKLQTWEVTQGCTPVGPGCRLCLAQQLLKQLGKPALFKVHCRPGALSLPLQKKKPCVFFVSPLGDLFHINVPISFLNDVFSVIDKTPQHTYHILTKRAERLCSYFKTRDIPKNVVLGVSAENMEYGEPRVKLLRTLAGRATILFVAAEPLLGPLTDLDLTGIDWLTLAREKGAGAVAVNMEHVRELEEYCKKCGVFFLNTLQGAHGWGLDSLSLIAEKKEKINEI